MIASSIILRMEHLLSGHREMELYLCVPRIHDKQEFNGCITQELWGLPQGKQDAVASDNSQEPGRQEVSIPVPGIL